MKQLLTKNFGLFLIASLTLGLAPFTPPHIWGKLQWIAGGGAISGEQPMQTADWLDLLMHGAPWVLMLISGSLLLFDKIKMNRQGSQS
ncbi:MAG: hypothetical protein IPO32_16300 [Crocinitomicaceae bacterium]|jgi:hypothetical protein|nr:hypothetical protein [Crocinitomicaceae bacterium]MBK9592984.1 hypothetical protein [Crocinitomicaceae bacterium]